MALVLALYTCGRLVSTLHASLLPTVQLIFPSTVQFIHLRGKCDSTCGIKLVYQVRLSLTLQKSSLEDERCSGLIDYSIKLEQLHLGGYRGKKFVHGEHLYGLLHSPRTFSFHLSGCNMYIATSVLLYDVPLIRTHPYTES